MSKRIVALISGSGSNLQAILDHCQQGSIQGQVVAVVSNRDDAFGLKRAEMAGVPGHFIDHRRFDGREAFDLALIDQIDAYQPDLVVLAGFMRILSPGFVRHYSGRLFNIHPSLLPRYKGLNTHQRVMDAGDPEHGCTVHFVTEELDGGPLVIQARTAVLTSDDSASLQARVHTLEHQIYPLAVSWFCADRLQQTDEGVQLDGVLLPASGFQLET
ncbi:Phosphoribosylglycinamide formyltransferase [Nitrincola lacisaponensis]|uniref:Phosphoribosylglycinamide formyltransferase n=1 Tax=Nitrincola lacisaponensis TaxID=267850 RepID=A0A063XY52_9GAMM|nr:phosphoribosylglycinamide formyltransferase [Nitrincola lacisaponensis]KDE38424.1 Phosphoribosylglycinamide formyltransferase [Nitrincola lacisaponensis]